MPRLIQCEDENAGSLEDCMESLGERGFDPEDPTSLDHAARALRRLANNGDFLGDELIERLKRRHRQTGPVSAYGPQSLVLTPQRGGCFLRANFWPSEHDSCLTASGARAFVYGVPHDHNFSFLTAGYFGPGYRSDYYEYDYESVAGYVGERPVLRFVERSALSKGKLVLYRAHRDIHSQLTPESLSVSLNIMRVDPAESWFDQYGFDLETGAVTGTLNPTSTETFLRCAVALGGGSAIDLAESFGRNHPSDRLRLASFEARALLGGDPDALWREAERSGSLLVAKEAEAYRRALG